MDRPRSRAGLGAGRSWGRAATLDRPGPALGNGSWERLLDRPEADGLFGGGLDRPTQRPDCDPGLDRSRIGQATIRALTVGVESGQANFAQVKEREG